MASVVSQMIEEVTAHAQSDSLGDAREIFANGSYFPNNLRILSDTHTHTKHSCTSRQCNFKWNTSVTCGPGSSVCLATELRAGRSGMESQWGRDFPLIQAGPGAHPASHKVGTGSFPRGKVRPGCAADHSPPSSAAVMEE